MQVLGRPGLGYSRRHGHDGAGLQGEVKRPFSRSAPKVAAERFGLGCKAHLALMISLVVHAPQDALPGVEIERGIEWRPRLDVARFFGAFQSTILRMSDSVQYITDERGERTAVLLPIATYEKLLEDLDDLAVVAERRDEPTISHEQFVSDLRRDDIV